MSDSFAFAAASLIEPSSLLRCGGGRRRRSGSCGIAGGVDAVALEELVDDARGLRPDLEPVARAIGVHRDARLLGVGDVVVGADLLDRLAIARVALVHDGDPPHGAVPATKTLESDHDGQVRSPLTALAVLLARFLLAFARRAPARLLVRVLLHGRGPALELRQHLLLSLLLQA